MAAGLWMPAIKMGEQALKKVMKAADPSLRAWIRGMQAFCYRTLQQSAREMQKAEQATVEDPNLAYEWCMLAEAQNCAGRFNEVIANAEKAIAMGTRRWRATSSRRRRKRWRRKRPSPRAAVRRRRRRAARARPTRASS